MKIIEVVGNKVTTRLMTPSEEQAYLAEQAQMAEEEANRLPTPEEQLRADVDFLLAMGGLIE